MADLLPCPFCSSDDVSLIEQAGICWVFCRACHTDGPTKDMGHEAVVVWNTRATPAVQEERDAWQDIAPAKLSYPDDSLIAKMVNEARVSVQDAADAARYRHLVATCNVDFDPSEPWQLVISEPSTGEDWKAKLNAAIDAAMKGDQP